MRKFIIADDHPLFRAAIRSVILGMFPKDKVYETQDLQSTLAQLEKDSNIDLVLFDLNMPDSDAFSGLIQIRNTYPEVPVVIISAIEDKPTVLQAITYGAIGFLTKSTNSKKIGEALNSILEGKVYLPPDIIRSVHKNDSLHGANKKKDGMFDLNKVASLTKRQLLVLEHMSKGESNKEIAYQLNIAETTVKVHVSTILFKLQVSNRVQAALQSSKLDFDKLLNRVL